MDRYQRRGLERLVRAARESAKVVILEGARAVGKTRLMRHLVEQGTLRSYADLSDPTTRAAAERDLEGWVRALATPAVIDEAQLVPELPLVVKRVVDERELALQFILTGSASIGRNALGGADPLTGRADRLVLRTFTEVERRGLGPSEPSPVEQLFDGVPRVNVTADRVDEDELLERIERGGLPEFALGASGDRARRAARVRNDVLDALSHDLRPEERFDAVRVRDTLDAVVRAPGRILNTVKLAETLALDRRTVERYLAVLEGRFLLNRLPNLALSPTTQAGSRAKAHAFDTAVAAESLRRAGVDLRVDRERFGQLFETWVVQQLTSAASWSAFGVDAYFWRRSQRPTSEVDLVLIDDRGRTVGVEVKAAHDVRPRDVDGLRALAAARALHRGFVVYLGRTVVQLDENIWALPVGLLNSGGGFRMPTTADRQTPGARPTSEVADEAVDATLFLSYAHADDEYLGGAMLRFSQALQQSYRFRYGREIRVFTDRTDLAWGVAWQRQLDAAAKDTQFLLAMVTPTYLRSDPCRREFEQFLSASGGARDELVLAVRWTPLPSSLGEDPVRAHVDAHQWLEAGDLATLEPGTAAYRAAVEGIAEHLHRVIEQRELPLVAASAPPRGSDEADLMEEFEAIERARPLFEHATERFGAALGAVGRAFESANLPESADTYASAAVFARLGRELEVPVEELGAANVQLTAEWSEIEATLSRVFEILPYIGGEEGRQELLRVLVEMQVSLQIPDLEQFEMIARMLGSISRHLRPASRELQNALRVIRTLQQSIRDLRSRVE